MKRELLNEIVATYEKHEWRLVEILHREPIGSGEEVDLGKSFESCVVRKAEIDGAWFSRPSRHDRQAWELRVIAEQPFALFETFPNDIDAGQLQKQRKEMETRILEMTSQK